MLRKVSPVLAFSAMHFAVGEIKERLYCETEGQTHHSQVGSCVLLWESYEQQTSACVATGLKSLSSAATLKL